MDQTAPFDLDDTGSGPSEPLRITARNLYWQGSKLADIARQLDVPYQTVDSWKRRDRWESVPAYEQIDAMVHQRLLSLILKADKTPFEVSELEHLTRLMESTARFRKYEQTGREGDINPRIAERNAKRDRGRAKKNAQKNLFSPEDVEKLRKDFVEGLYEYQRLWYEVRLNQKTRIILKSRQIGATWYFAREAFLDALETGNNKIFLSASKAQAMVFREYIVRWVKEVCDIDLIGNPLVLPNGATLYFLGTNARTAQSYHGDLYIDEFSWIGRFNDLRKVASGMASHKKWKITYFSTPSVKAHEGYAFWSGKHWNSKRRKADRIDFDISHANLRHGAICPDGAWRHIVTLIDAAEQGCDLFDLEETKQEHSPEDFENLYMCQWVDDEESFFTFAELQRCMVDSFEAWSADWTPDAPFALPVWVGYDPSRSQDNAAIAVIAPPSTGNGKYRLIERQVFTGADWQSQADRIKALCERYDVKHIGVDATAIGEGVYELVTSFYPGAKRLQYSAEVKTRMVVKGKHLISKRLFQFDAGDTLVAMSFLAIRKTMTASGRYTTFTAVRSQETGHADLAWAILNALDHAHFSDMPTEDGSVGQYQATATIEIF